MEYDEAFIIMGITILASSVLSVFIFIKGHAGLICGSDAAPAEAEKAETLAVPTPDAEKADEVNAEAEPTPVEEEA